MVLIIAGIFLHLFLLICSFVKCDCPNDEFDKCRTHLMAIPEAVESKDLKTTCAYWNKFMDCVECYMVKCVELENRVIFYNITKSKVAGVEKLCSSAGYGRGLGRGFHTKPFLIGLLMLFVPLRLF